LSGKEEELSRRGKIVHFVKRHQRLAGVMFADRDARFLAAAGRSHGLEGVCGLASEITDKSRNFVIVDAEDLMPSIKSGARG
jgi:hypothetical protein